METLKLMSYQVNYVTRETPTNLGFGEFNNYGPKIAETNESGSEGSDLIGFGPKTLPSGIATYQNKSANEHPYNLPTVNHGLFGADASTTSPVLSQSDSLQQNGCNILQMSPDLREVTLKSCTPSPSIGSLTSSPTSSFEQISDPSSPETDINDIDAVLKSLEKTAKAGATKPEKPNHSYVALTVEAILSKPEKRMILGDIYKYIQENFEYYNNEERAWRNSIRHNLSLNECFIKAGRADSGKGNYWSIHPACIEDFSKGDYRKRNARRRNRGGSKGLKTQQPNTPYPYQQYVPMSSDTLSYPPPMPYPYQMPSVPQMSLVPEMPSVTQMPSQLQPQTSTISCMGKYQQPMPITYRPQLSVTGPLTNPYSSKPRATIHYEPQTSLPNMDIYRAPYNYLSSNNGYHSNTSMIHYPSVNKGGY